jgi:hypothetical protein
MEKIARFVQQKSDVEENNRYLLPFTVYFHNDYRIQKALISYYSIFITVFRALLYFERKQYTKILIWLSIKLK